MRRVTALGLVAALMWSAPALADEHPGIASARAEIEAVRFDRANELLDSALASGRLAAADVVTAHRLKAEVGAALGNASDAERHFAAALSLDPGLELGEFPSPKIVEVFEAARQRLGGAKLVVGHDVDGHRAILRVESDPAQLVVAAEVAHRLPDGAEKTLRQEGQGAIDIDLPPEARRGVSLYAIDEHGNRLIGFYLGDLDEDPEPETAVARPASAPAPPGDPSGRSLVGRWWLWAGVSVAFAATGATFGLMARSKQNELDDIRDESGEHFFSDAKAAEDAARVRALGANLSFALAGAAGIAAGVLFVTSRGEPEVAVTPQSGGAAASVRVAF